MDLRSFSNGIARCGFLAASLLIAGPAMANPYETMLPNGLRVIVKEDRRAPVAVHMVWYRVGAMDEKDGTTGVAHLLEHMMFKGTKKLKAGEFNEIVARAGGSDNAFTSQDYTAYFQRVPAAALPRMIELEADRMRNLVINDDEFERELKVVMEERRLRTDDKPQAQVYEQLMASAFTAHPYRRPIIGWMNDLENMRPDDARDWYHRWYAPNNAYVVVVGDVDHKAVFSLVKKHYGRMKAEPLPVRKTTAEPLQTGQRRVVVKAPAEVPQIVMAWKVPRLTDVTSDREPYALDVLAGILDGHAASRLSRNLVRGSQVATEVGAYYDSTARGEVTFVLGGAPARGRTVAELEAALRAEVKRIADEGVAEAELERVKTLTVAAQVYKRDSTYVQAMEIGRLEAAGYRWQDSDLMLEKLRTVTAAEVQAVAQKYFGDDTLTVAVLDPQPLDPNAKPRAKPAGLRH
ncbi:MAG: insulinase family protein [Methyloversatilis sp.]|nr:insulinase family protein [Methyloversatilis sp.]MBP6193739.1 insulinase family protein [Methyloversatilis sp.]MBP9117747.1 insulinase family protein [Methyloversatilis sp.]